MEGESECDGCWFWTVPKEKNSEKRPKRGFDASFLFLHHYHVYKSEKDNYAFAPLRTSTAVEQKYLKGGIN